MKKILTLAFLFVALFLLPSMAAAGAASVYKITITKMELHNGTEFIEVFSGTSTVIDIASSAAGSSTGNFLSGIVIPDGTYSQVRTTVSQTITVSGVDGVNYTTADTDVDGNDNTGCVNTTTAADEAECEAIVATAPVDTTTFSVPITALNNNLSHKIRVDFDVSAALTFITNALYLNAPTVTVTAVPLE